MTFARHAHTDKHCSVLLLASGALFGFLSAKPALGNSCLHHVQHIHITLTLMNHLLCSLSFSSHVLLAKIDIFYAPDCAGSESRRQRWTYP